MIKNLINISLIQTVQTIRTAMVRIEKGRTYVTRNPVLVSACNETY